MEEVSGTKIVGDVELVQKVIEGLKEVYDPEIPVNVYDLGLVYEIHVMREGDKVYVKILMTLTAIGCPVSGQIALFVEEAVRERIPEAEVEVEITFDPPWTPLRITKEGREQFVAIYGYDIVEQWTRSS